MLRLGAVLPRCTCAPVQHPRPWLPAASPVNISSRDAFTVPSGDNVANPGDFHGEKYKVPKETFRPSRYIPRKKTPVDEDRQPYDVDAIVRELSRSKSRPEKSPDEPTVVGDDEEMPQRKKDKAKAGGDGEPLEYFPFPCERLGFMFDTLPPKLHKAVRKVLKSFQCRQYTMDGIRLSKYLYNRNIPWTEIVPDFTPHIFAAKLRHRPLIDEKKVMETYVESDMPWFEVPIIGKRLIPKHTAVRYGSREAVAYMASRLDSHYAVTYRVLNEIRKRMPDFEPKHVLDFGSGLGSATWAANSVWGKSIKEYVCVDTSSTMTDMANVLHRQGDAKSRPSFKNVFYRNFMPVSTDVKYDVVIAAHSLSELTSEEDRWRAIETLWQKTEKYLVIVEHGFWPGFNIVREARRIVLREKAFVRGKNLRSGATLPDLPGGFKIYDEQDFDSALDWPEGHVFAPCPHDGPCPKERMIVNGTCHRACNFSNNLNGSVAEKNLNMFMAVHHKERLSYVVFKKGKREETKFGEYDRLLRPLQRRGGHALALVCRASGELEINTYTKAKNPVIYRSVRRARWGDMLPHIDVATGRRILSQAPRKHKQGAGASEQDCADGDSSEEQALKPYNPEDAMLEDFDERTFDAGKDDAVEGSGQPKARRRAKDDPDFAGSDQLYADEFEEH